MLIPPDPFALSDWRNLIRALLQLMTGFIENSGISGTLFFAC